MKNPIRERYIAHYAKAVGAFIGEVDKVNAAGIPEVHLPLWGSEYGTISPRIVFIGRDTRNWGGMEGFIECARKDTHSVIPRECRENEFLNFPFKKGGDWAKKGNSIFWDAVMRFLAAFHNVDNWKKIKVGYDNDAILRTLVWANTNAVELWGKKKLPGLEKKLGKKADKGSWTQLKLAAERHLDSFATIQEIFQPDVAIVMSRNAPINYWPAGLQAIEIGNRINYAFDGVHRTHVFHTDHPASLNRQHVRLDDVVKSIHSKWCTSQSSTMSAAAQTPKAV